MLEFYWHDMGLPDTDTQIFQDPSNIKNADNKQKRRKKSLIRIHSYFQRIQTQKNLDLLGPMNNKPE